VVEQYAMYIDGAWASSASGETIDSVNPWTQQVAQVPSGTDHDSDRAVTSGPPRVRGLVVGTGRSSQLERRCHAHH
jgi:hypothetical protein